MIYETLIRSALSPDTRGLSRKEPRSDLVPVRSYDRAKPVNPKREALHNALRRAVAS